MVATPQPVRPRVARPPAERLARPDTCLRGAAAFEAVFRHGKRREGRYVQLVIAPAATAGASPQGRYGFVVSSKVMPRAVDRNRFKRVLRARLAGLRDQAAPFDLVIRIKRRVPPQARVEAVSEAAALLDAALGADGVQAPALPC